MPLPWKVFVFMSMLVMLLLMFLYFIKNKEVSFIVDDSLNSDYNINLMYMYKW